MTADRCDLICIDAPMAEAIRGRLLGEEAAWEASERARALSAPTRLKLAAALREGEELSESRLAPPAGAQGLEPRVRSRRDGKLVMYSLTSVGRSLLDAVLDARVGERV